MQSIAPIEQPSSDSTHLQLGLLYRVQDYVSRIAVKMDDDPGSAKSQITVTGLRDRTASTNNTDNTSVGSLEWSGHGSTSTDGSTERIDLIWFGGCERLI